jgi:hypothetical protein
MCESRPSAIKKAANAAEWQDLGRRLPGSFSSLKLRVGFQVRHIDRRHWTGEMVDSGMTAFDRYLAGSELQMGMTRTDRKTLYRAASEIDYSILIGDRRSSSSVSFMNYLAGLARAECHQEFSSLSVAWIAWMRSIYPPDQSPE